MSALLFIRRSCAACAVVFLSGMAMPALLPLTGEAAAVEQAGSNEKDRAIEQILIMLKHRSCDSRILTKAEGKLCAMPHGKVLLIATLCDRIAEDDDAAGADIAYSVVTAMIVLS